MPSPGDAPPPPDPDAPRRGVQSVGVAVDVLAALARGGDAMTLGEVAAAAGLAPAKAHRYLASLIEKGLVVQQGRAQAYGLGRLAAEIGLAALSRISLVNEAADGLPDLARRTGLGALLSVWGAEGATIVRIERSQRLITTALALGSRLPLMNSATGHCFFAHLPPRLTEGERAREGALGAEGADAIAARVRADGFAAVDGQFIPGLAAIAAPVLDAQGWPEAVVSLIGVDPTLTEVTGPAIAALKAYAAGVGTG
ncbi:MAG: helix-turn-helix domain-containing protein [Marivibrio sp.]|uniref:IclR family transcriptional regulator n=1 Tax=Marivibrio sp. TaxID=2039719 RepID=UPI0032EE6E39